EQAHVQTGRGWQRTDRGQGRRLLVRSAGRPQLGGHHPLRQGAIAHRVHRGPVPAQPSHEDRGIGPQLRGDLGPAPGTDEAHRDPDAEPPEHEGRQDDQDDEGETEQHRCHVSILRSTSHKDKRTSAPLCSWLLNICRLDPTRRRALRSAVETGSSRASAEALGYTPSAVSQHLSILRRETGLELLERSGRGVRVTETARAVAQEAGKVLDALDALDHRVADLRAGRTGTLHFGYATSVAATWVPELAREVRQRFPDLGLGLALRDCGGPE